MGDNQNAIEIQNLDVHYSLVATVSCTLQKQSQHGFQRICGVHGWHIILYEMGMKEKEYEIYFRDKIKNSKVLTYFEKLFGWGGA
ncbi:MAG: hypothetical protein ABI683_10160 [Ginsengibacter sp.]